jgi:orotate phosphoribosyltransferase-like protein
VLIDIEGLAGKTVIIEQITAALNRHRKLIEQLACAIHKPGVCRVFLDRQELERVMNDAVRSAP